MRLLTARSLGAVGVIALMIPAQGCGRIGYGVSAERDADQSAGDASMDAARRDAALRDGALSDAVAMLPSGCIAMIADDFEDGVVAPEWFRFEEPRGTAGRNPSKLWHAA
jgi:hypothetical protein